MRSSTGSVVWPALGCSVARRCTSNVASWVSGSSSRPRTISGTTSTASTCFRGARPERNNELAGHFGEAWCRQITDSPSLQLLGNLHHHVPPLRHGRQNERLRQRGLDHVRQLVASDDSATTSRTIAHLGVRSDT